MSKFALWLVSTVMVASAGCHGDDESAEEPPPAARAEPRRVPQVQPPIDVKAPPKDAAKTASGLRYKRLVERSNGLQARPDESVLIRYTGWRQSSGETFFTTGTDGQAITINPTYAAPTFREVIPLLHKGEQIIVWVPAGGGMAEPVVVRGLQRWRFEYRDHRRSAGCCGHRHERRHRRTAVRLSAYGEKHAPLPRTRRYRTVRAEQESDRLLLS